VPGASLSPRLCDVWRESRDESPPPGNMSNCKFGRIVIMTSLAELADVKLPPAGIYYVVFTGQTGLGPIFQGRPTSTWNWSRTGRSPVTSKSSSTGPPSIDGFAGHATPNERAVLASAFGR
jgi:hypothetical protein